MESNCFECGKPLEIEETVNIYMTHDNEQDMDEWEMLAYCQTCAQVIESELMDEGGE